MNFNNSKLAHFLSFVCVFESKVPRHAFLEATKKKKNEFFLCRHLVTESYSRNRGKQNGAIVTIFSLITIILVSKSRKDVLKLLLSRGYFLRVFHLLAGFDKIVRVILLTSFSYFPIYL